MKTTRQSDSLWGKRSLITIPIGAVLIGLSILAIYISHGYTLRGFGASFTMVFPLFFGIPMIVTLGLSLAIVGLQQDKDKQLANIAITAWFLIAAASAFVIFA